MTPDRLWSDVRVGDEMTPLRLPITVHRMVVFAGGNRDFAAIHHNENVAHHSGAPHVFANNVFCQGMWERAVRDWAGPGARILRIGPFRLRAFNAAGRTITTTGRVVRIWEEDDRALVELELTSTDGDDVTVGPGPVVVALMREPLHPRQDD
jgi:hypothetical protein